MNRLKVFIVTLFSIWAVLFSHNVVAQDSGKLRILDFQPIKYFNNQCARCHGPGGSFYGDEFARDKSMQELHSVVEEMAAGPAGSPVTGDTLDALVAYHISLSRDLPFITIDTLSDSVLAGEVTQTSSVRIMTDDGGYTAAINGNRWRYRHSFREVSNIRISATSDNHSITIQPGQQLFAPRVE